MKKKGFTLIELLAVIVILAVIALILVPIVSSVIDSSRKAAFKESVNGIIDSTNNYISEYVLKHKDDITYPVTFVCDGISCKNGDDILTFKGTVPKGGNLILTEEGVLAEYITDGKYCAYGHKWDLVVEGSCGEVDVTKPTVLAELSGQKINITMADNESGIYGYCVTKDDNCNYIKANDSYVEHDLSEHGTYKVYAKDKKGNVSEYVLVDAPIENFKPSVSATLSGKTLNLSFTVMANVDSYCINTSDTTDGCNWVSTNENSVEYTLETSGTYYVFVKDKKGYISDSFETVVSPDLFCSYISNEVVFNKTSAGAYTYQVPAGCTGTYMLEVYGAQGANSSGSGGRGGYAYGNITLTEGTTLYIAVGGAGSGGSAGYNGGGTGNGEGVSGGGATHIATTLRGNGTLSNYNSYRSEVLIVAGGGGGGSVKAGGGAGGGTSGGNGGSGSVGAGRGGTQTGGAGFGTGANCTTSMGDKTGGGGGGGGWYGGTSVEYGGGGGGGSGYLNTSMLISGTTGMSNGVKSSAGQVKISFVGIKYKIEFDANGGTVSVPSKEVDPSNNIMGNMPVPTNGTKKFYGWYTDTTYKRLITEASVIRDNMHLYARWADDEIDFSYGAYVAGIRVPVTGTYKLEVWGAQGANSSYSGGAGGYSYGNVNLEAGSYVYAIVGGAGSGGSAGYNGGGTGNGEGASGGGATHFALTGTLLKDTSAANLLIVAGGGGGGSVKATGGTGGGTSGGNGGSGSVGYGRGGTQTTGAAYGQGANCTTSMGDKTGGGAGGGGYYGGTAVEYGGGGGGGSGYLSSYLISGTTGMSNGVRSGSGYAKITLIN